MQIELKNGATYEMSLESLKRLSYQNIRGNVRYYVALGNDMQATEIEITRSSYIALTEAIIDGTLRNQAEDTVLLSVKKRSNRKPKGTE